MTSPPLMQLPAGFRPAAPTIATEPVAACPICAGVERDWCASGHDYEIETCCNQWDFWACRDCGGLWLDPRPAASEIGTIYPSHYYSYNIESNVSPLALKGKEILDRLKFRAILKRLGREPATYLDIGCGNGRYLEFFAKRNIPRDRIYGLELSTSRIEDLNRRGFSAFNQRVEECNQIPNGSIDLATMFHVLEHVADPAAVVGKIRDWLSVGGCLVVETPNVDALDARLFAGRWWGGYHIPRHWTLFNDASLRRLLTDNGFDVEHVAYQTGHSFWMYSLHHSVKYNGRWASPRIARWFDPIRGLPMLIAFTGFDTVRRLAGFKTSTILTIARRRA